MTSESAAAAVTIAATSTAAAAAPSLRALSASSQLRLRLRLRLPGSALGLRGLSGDAREAPRPEHGAHGASSLRAGGETSLKFGFRGKPVEAESGPGRGRRGGGRNRFQVLRAVGGFSLIRGRLERAAWERGWWTLWPLNRRGG